MWRLLRLGVSLAEQGLCDANGDAPGYVLDMLLGIDDTVAQAKAEARKRQEAGSRGR